MSTGVLALVLAKLQSSQDVHSARAVCKSWRDAVAECCPASHCCWRSPHQRLVLTSKRSWTTTNASIRVVSRVVLCPLGCGVGSRVVWTTATDDDSDVAGQMSSVSTGGLDIESCVLLDQLHDLAKRAAELFSGRQSLRWCAPGEYVMELPRWVTGLDKDEESCFSERYRLALSGLGGDMGDVELSMSVTTDDVELSHLPRAAGKLFDAIGQLLRSAKAGGSQNPSESSGEESSGSDTTDGVKRHAEEAQGNNKKQRI
eukprot:m51a1_g2971 hypothetical protein (258) ;mRNA; f:702623-703396